MKWNFKFICEIILFPKGKVLFQKIELGLISQAGSGVLSQLQLKAGLTLPESQFLICEMVIYTLYLKYCGDETI